MEKALIIWGGWQGHKPKLTGNILKEELIKNEYEVKLTNNLAVLINEDLNNYDVIIPIWSVGIKSSIYLKPLMDAIREGVGLAAFHGAIKWFIDDYYYHLIGGNYIKDSEEENFQVKIVNQSHPITEYLEDFEIISEKYYLQFDPRNNILAEADFGDVKMPISWTKKFGDGRIFYTSLAHSPEHLFEKHSLKMLIEAINWTAGRL